MKKWITGLPLLSLTLGVFGGCDSESDKNSGSESAYVMESAEDPSTATEEGKILGTHYVARLLYNREYPASTYTSCYVTNTNYTAPPIIGD